MQRIRTAVVIAVVSLIPTLANADIVLDWNAIAVNTLVSEILRRAYGEGGHAITMASARVPGVTLHYQAACRRRRRHEVQQLRRRPLLDADREVAALIQSSQSSGSSSRSRHALRLCRRRRETRCCIRPSPPGLRNVTKPCRLLKWPSRIGRSGTGGDSSSVSPS